MEKKTIKRNKTFFYITIIFFILLLIISLLGIFVDEVSLLIVKPYMKFITWMENLTETDQLSYGKILSYFYLTCVPCLFTFLRGHHEKLLMGPHLTISRVFAWLAFLSFIGTVYLFFRFTKPYFETFPKYEGSQADVYLWIVIIPGKLKDWLVNFKNIYVLYILPVVIPILLLLKNYKTVDKLTLGYMSFERYCRNFLIWDLIIIIILPFILMYIAYAAATVAVFVIGGLIGIGIWYGVSHMPEDKPSEIALMSDGTVLKKTNGVWRDEHYNQWDEVAPGTFER